MRIIKTSMPRPLHDEVDYRSALNVLDAMAEHGMNESDLGRLLGDRSLGHRVLSP